MTSSAICSFCRGAVDIISLSALFYGPEYIPLLRATNSHIPRRGWSTSVALCPTMHTYIPLQVSGLQSIISSNRFCLCFFLAKCTKCASLGAKSSSGFVLETWVRGMVLQQGLLHRTLVQSCIIVLLSPHVRKAFFQRGYVHLMNRP